MSLCDKCSHNSVCKYVNDLATAEKSVSMSDSLTLFTVEVRCKCFDDNTRVKNLDTPQIDWTSPSVTPIPTNITTWPLACENCDFYRRHLSKGKTYIGDSPCLWCEKYPFKITYAADGTNSSTTSKSILY